MHTHIQDDDANIEEELLNDERPTYFPQPCIRIFGGPWAINSCVIKASPADVVCVGAEANVTFDVCYFGPIQVCVCVLIWTYLHVHVL